MAILEQLLPADEPDRSGPVELVILTPDQLTHGQGTGNALAFMDIRSALDHANQKMSQDQRSMCWIRQGDVVLTLSQAEQELQGSANAARCA